MKENQCLAGKQALLERLKDDIMMGVHLPGSKLNIEKLKSHYQVGTCPIREALQQLAALGFIEAHHLRGFKVATFKSERMLDIINCRKLIELDAMKSALRLGDDEWEAQVVAAYYRLDKFQSSPDFNPETDTLAWMKLIRRFQHAIVSGCQSEVQTELVQLLYEQSDPYCYIHYRSHFEDPEFIAFKKRFFKSLFDSILARDMAEVETNYLEGVQHLSDLFQEDLQTNESVDSA